MRKNPAWLAASLLIFVVIACKYSAGTNSNSGSNSGPITKITMAKDNGSGEPGDETNTFTPGDHKLHCLVTLKEPKEGTKVTFLWWVVDAGGIKNQMLKQLDYTTEENVKVVHGNLSSSRDWQSGKYKVETQINGVSARTVNFTVE